MRSRSNSAMALSTWKRKTPRGGSRELYRRFEEFCSLRRGLDPKGVFLNLFLRSLFEES